MRNWSTILSAQRGRNNNPKENSEDDSRRRQVLGLVLLSMILVVGIIVAISIFSYYAPDPTSERAISPLVSVALFLFFVELWYANRRGFTKIASYIFLTAYFLAVLYAGRFWGASMPIGLLSYALFITMAGIVISSRFGLIASCISILAIAILGIEENAKGILPAWKMENIQVLDIVAYSVMIGLAAFFSWFSTRELEKMLTRARASEADLKTERDNLELTVDLRTRELKQAEIERSVELARFAEFGKLSAGIFHDIVNPLTTISLSLQEMDLAESPTRRLEAKENIESALRAARRMEASVARARKNIKNDDRLRSFNGEEELRDAVGMLDYRARENHVELRLNLALPLLLFGDPLKFYQACMNVILNAIESYKPLPEGRPERAVEITCRKDDARYEIIISDHGVGMDAEAVKKSFDPFFTTKESGIGLGLAIAKSIIEEHFRGSITCTSIAGEGTTFVISLPCREPGA